MSVGRFVWQLRRRILGPERVVTADRVALLSRSHALQRRGRLEVRALLLRELALGPPARARIAIGDARIELGDGAGFAIDWKAFAAIFADDEYLAEYGGACVLDVGAHKGYFGAFALASGASAVVSFEPEARNYETLARTAKGVGDKWLTRQAAVGEKSGTGTLLVDRLSWSHSLVQVARPVGEQPVAIVTLEQALEDVPAESPFVIVKIDAEGSECDILARPEALARVDVLLVEWHAEKAPCSKDELTRSVERAGLRLRPRNHSILRFARTPGGE
jgi:FkbM family methyltransferase